jgi:protocatechuate 3,4-dioxygenase beta subunit
MSSLLAMLRASSNQRPTRAHTVSCATLGVVPPQLTIRVGVSGEYVRQDITDANPGLPLTFDVQVIDTTTCKPIPQVAVEVWHCNSTGVYGGVVAEGNGNTADASNINNTMFRGIQFSNENGILQFDTTFPGHYTGRTNHIHGTLARRYPKSTSLTRT